MAGTSDGYLKHTRAEDWFHGEAECNEARAKLVYYWSKVRQALKMGRLTAAGEWLEKARCDEYGHWVSGEIVVNVSVTMTTGVEVMRDHQNT